MKKGFPIEVEFTDEEALAKLQAILDKQEENTMPSFRPIGAQILVRPTQALADKLVGGIYLPESMTKNDPAVQGVVEAVGSGVRLPNGVLLTPDVKPGDKVLFHRYGATEIKVGDDKMYLVTEESILGILEDLS